MNARGFDPPRGATPIREATRRTALRARYVFPIASEPILDGALTIAGGRIVAVGRWPAAASSADEVIDLGSAALLPGFVNAHTHLEFSDLARPLGRPGMIFPEWIRQVIAQRRQAATEPAVAIAAGLRESLQGGVTTLGEIATAGWTAAPLGESPIEVTAFREVLGLRRELVEERFASLREFARAESEPRFHIGISPHAPYSVHPELLARCVERACQSGVPLAMHLAESREELEWLAAGTGPFREVLVELGAWDEATIPLGTRPLDTLRPLATVPRALIIHGNYLADDEIALLASHAQSMSLVYCPRTHAYFGHAPYPLARLLAAGVNVAVGTDSRASNPDLSVLAELRHIAKYHDVPLSAVLRLGTLRGAQALGLDRRIGSLEPGKQADLCSVVLPADHAADAHELLLLRDGEVRDRWKSGRRFA